MCAWLHRDGDRCRSALFAFERLSHGCGLPARSIQRLAGHARRSGAHLVQLAAVAAGTLAAHAARLGLVSHALELRHARPTTGRRAWLRSLARDHPAHPAQVGLCVEAGAPRDARRRPRAERQAGTDSPLGRDFARQCRAVLRRRTGHPPAAEARLRVDAAGDAKRSDDAGHEPEELSGRRSEFRLGTDAARGWGAQKPLVVH